MNNPVTNEAVQQQNRPSSLNIWPSSEDDVAQLANYNQPNTSTTHSHNTNAITTMAVVQDLTAASHGRGGEAAAATSSPDSNNSKSNATKRAVKKNYQSIGMDRRMDFHCHALSSTITGSSSISRREAASRSAKRKLVAASFLVLAFIMLEVLGGLASHSLAIMADAAHMLSDFASLGVSLAAIYLAERSVSR